jgi:uncharacterized circularly permuted ATP-grasp superfamily protein
MCRPGAAPSRSLAYVMDNLADLVVKEVHGSGGYGMLIGPTSSRKEIAMFAEKLRANPENYIAQPTLSLSTVPIFTKAGLAPRHVDLRPFVLVSPQGIDITPGGLTRVALKKGSLVVNSSQGGAPRTVGCWTTEAEGKTIKCLDVPPMASSGCSAIWSGPKTPRAWSRPVSAWR